jgi:hypothetical protein
LAFVAVTVIHLDGLSPFRLHVISNHPACESDMARPAGWCGARGRLCNPLPGGAEHHPSGTMTGARGASLDWDRQERVTPAQRMQSQERPRPRKPGLTLSLWDESPSGKSRGGTPTDVRIPLTDARPFVFSIRHCRTLIRQSMRPAKLARQPLGVCKFYFSMDHRVFAR